MDKIELYYKELGLMPLLAKRKLEDYKRNPDIANEFIYWIESKNYLVDMCIDIEGFTAHDIAARFPQLDADSVFSLMIELREKPDLAKKRISAGFEIL